MAKSACSNLEHTNIAQRFEATLLLSWSQKLKSAKLLSSKVKFKTISDFWRHFAHGLTSIVRNLMSDDELNEDGTTNGGCTDYEGWPLGDTRCPVTDDSVYYWILAVAISVPVGFLLLLCLICRCCRCCCFKKKGCCCRPYEKTDQNDQLKVNVTKQEAFAVNYKGVKKG